MIAAPAPDLLERIALAKVARLARGWTDERVGILKTLWAEGLSCGQIAKRIGGFSRNAVIGKVHRLGLDKRRSLEKVAKPQRVRVNPTTIAIARREAQARALHDGPALAPVIALSPDDRTDMACSLFDLNETTCRWPIGDPVSADFFFCGQPSVHEKSYCMAHCSRAFYTPVTRNLSDEVREKRRAQAWVNWGNPPKHKLNLDGELMP